MQLASLAVNHLNENILNATSSGLILSTIEPKFSLNKRRTKFLQHSNNWFSGAYIVFNVDKP